MARQRANRPVTPMLGAGWSFPPRRRDGDYAMAADDLVVQQSIDIILSTDKGERVMRPDFGCNLRQLLFAPNNGATQAMAAFEVTEALKTWEPRIDLLNVTAHAGQDAPEQLLIDISYRVRSTDNRFNLVYPFYLNRSLT